jgi:two-component system sensor histidine kinase VicK
LSKRFIYIETSRYQSWRSHLLIQTQRPRILYGPQNTNRAILQSISNSKSGIDICGNYTMQAIEHEVFKKILSDARDRGIRFRCIMEITKENIDCCKKLMELVEIRHLAGLKAEFVLNQTKCLSIDTTTTNALQERNAVPQIVYIDIIQIVEQYHRIFDTLWDNTTTISAQQRIKEIEERLGRRFTLDVIQDRRHAESLFLAQIREARSEVLIAVSSLVDLEHFATIGLVDSIKQARHIGVTIMILHSEEEWTNDAATRSQLISDMRKCSQIKRISGIQGIILLIDNAKLLTISDRDENGDSRLDFTAVYSDNKSLAKNFGSLLDSLINETEMLESMIAAKDNLADINQQLAEANEQLTIHGRMQREFIDVAAHELRTPIQSILGYAELLEEEQEDEISTREQRRAAGGGIESSINNKKNSIRAVIRNAKRLEQLSHVILDVTKIENKSLNLNKESLNLNDVILTAIDDLVIYTAKDLYKKNNRIKLRYEPIENNIFVDADKYRLTQVISNLLRNAVKFTKEGYITINTEKKEDCVLVKIRDTGSGIDPEIIPRLFTKFATKSDEGTGLGLFICRGIIEAHGGRIWAENNREGEKRGATFTFSLPFTKK